MTKKERELRQKLQEKREEVQKLIEEGKIEEARSAMNEAKQIKNQIELLVEARELEAPEAGDLDVPPKGQTKENRDHDELQAEYRAAFLKMLRGKRLSSSEQDLLERPEFRAMSGQNDEDGGLIIPQDISTKINELKRDLNPLEQYVTVEPVVTRSGKRVLEKAADMVPFAEITEMGNIGETDNPKFTPISYEIKDYGGILPISNTLLADTDQNLINYISRWFAKKSVVTRNSLILNVLDQVSKTAFSGIDDIKKALNVTLDPMISVNAIILTNQDGFNYLDQLKDGEGNYILQPNPVDPTQKMISGVPVVVASNKVLPTSGTSTKKAPVIVGDLKEAVVLFDRQQQSLASTNIGAGAFETNTTKVRAIEREDVQPWDLEAVVYGQITLS